MFASRQALSSFLSLPLSLEASLGMMQDAWQRWDLAGLSASFAFLASRRPEDASVHSASLELWRQLVVVPGKPPSQRRFLESCLWQLLEQLSYPDLNVVTYAFEACTLCCATAA